MSNTNNATNTVYNVAVEAEIANQAVLPEMSESEARSLAINVLNSSMVLVSSQEARKFVVAEQQTALKQVVLLTQQKLREKFGPKMDFFHGELESDLVWFRATVDELVAKGELQAILDVDSDILMWTEKAHSFSFQVFKGERRRTSQLIVKLKNNVQFRDVQKEAEDRAIMHENVYKSNKMPLQRPAYIAAQKGEEGIRVAHRHSSVQLATDFASFILEELNEKKKGLTRSMNMLNEFVQLKERMDITDEQRARLSQETQRLLSVAKEGLETIQTERDSYNERAQIFMGMKTVHDTHDFKVYVAQKRAAKIKIDMEETKKAFALPVGQVIWNKTTEGKRNSARRKVMTAVELDRLAELNNSYTEQMKAEVLNSSKVLTKELKMTNTTMKMAIVAYIDAYDTDKNNLSGLASMWDVFEEGLLMALDAMATQGPLMDYKPSSTELSFFFEPAMKNEATVLLAQKELKAKKILGKDIEVITLDGEVGLQLDAGFFPLEKQEKKVKWLPVGRNYVAKVTRYTGKSTSGISMGLSDIRAINVEEEVETVESVVIAPTPAPVDADYDWAQEPAPDYVDNFFFEDYSEETVDVVASQPQPVVLVPTDIIVATLERNSVELVLSQQYEMTVSPEGTQVFMLHGGQRVLSFTTNVQLASLDGIRHDGMNFLV